MTHVNIALHSRPVLLNLAKLDNPSTSSTAERSTRKGAHKEKRLDQWNCGLDSGLTTQFSDGAHPLQPIVNSLSFQRERFFVFYTQYAYFPPHPGQGSGT